MAVLVPGIFFFFDAHLPLHEHKMKPDPELLNWSTKDLNGQCLCFARFMVPVVSGLPPSPSSNWFQPPDLLGHEMIEISLWRIR